MAEYIDKDKLFKKLAMLKSQAVKRAVGHPTGSNWAKNFAAQAEMIEIVENYISTADVVEVVRCKDCKHYCPSAFGGFTCFGRRIPSVSEDDYCNYGERREEDTDNDK